MISSTALAFSSQQPLPSPRQAPSPLVFSSMSEAESKPSPPPPTSESQTRKFKTSPQLNRWSRARSFRSGIKPDRPTRVKPAPNPVVRRNNSGTESALGVVLTEQDSGFSDGIEETNELERGKSIYMVSDGTGWTVEHSVTAALGQFEHCLVDRVCPVNTHLFSGVDDVDRLIEIIKQAAKEEAMVVYTLADPEIAESAQKACEIWGVKSADILSPITDAISSHLGVSPSGLPRWAKGRSSTLNEDYFKRIDAIEFTIKQDDGALPQNLHKADIVLAGVSRCGKTPLSIYLAQKGYKVANVPIVMNVDLPRTLFEVDPEKVFGLTINPLVLQTIRRARAKTLGFGDDVRSSYSEMDSVKEELEFARKIFAKNPVWPVIEVTGKAIEETAATVLRMYHDRKNKCVMPRISKRY